MPQVTLYVPDHVRELMDNTDANWSKLFQKAVKQRSSRGCSHDRKLIEYDSAVCLDCGRAV